jgi:signal recognition particle subunit SRP19
MNASKFQIIYPSYLDSTKSIKQGRRIGKEEAVSVPTVSDLSLALQTLKIRHVLQPYKGYSRDIETLWENPGRVKVDLSNNESKRELLLQLAKIIPTLPERQKRLEEEAKQNLILLEKEEKERQESQKAAQQHQTQQQQVSKSTNKTANNKKTGKKKR